MQRIDGKHLADIIRHDVQEAIATSGLQPRLAVLLVGDDPASHLYVGLKEKAAAEAGMTTDIRRLPASSSDEDLKGIIEAWNADETVHAILIQLPLPPGHDTDAIIATMDPRKDVDGFHPQNAAALLDGTATLFPPVHESILRLIGSTPRDMRGAKAVIIANSETFSAPLGRLLSIAGCAVETFDPNEIDRDILQDADIIVVAVGRPRFLTRDMVKSGACVIDVGTNRLPDGKLIGDADAENLADIPGWLSPVPGGVGPLTVALLLKNTFELAKRS
jgi:methylenetetrahydrofolate dehydrogenase (NADP+)/methenyltetrahydrofolate cyclohydrolase